MEKLVTVYLKTRQTGRFPGEEAMGGPDPNRGGRRALAGLVSKTSNQGLGIFPPQKSRDTEDFRVTF